MDHETRNFIVKIRLVEVKARVFLYSVILEKLVTGPICQTNLNLISFNVTLTTLY